MVRKLTLFAVALAIVPSLAAQDHHGEDPPEPFMLRFVEQYAMDAGLVALRTSTLVEDDVEIRLWEGFGLVGTWAHVVRRQSGQWSAFKVDRSYSSDQKTRHGVTQLEAVGDWDERFESLVELGMLDLPVQVEREWIMLDGHTYLLEVRVGEAYRVSEIESLEDPEVEADRLIKVIARMIREGTTPLD